MKIEGQVSHSDLNPSNSLHAGDKVWFLNRGQSSPEVQKITKMTNYNNVLQINIKSNKKLTQLLTARS